MITVYFSFITEQMSMNYWGVCFVFQTELTLVCMPDIIMSRHHYNWPWLGYSGFYVNWVQNQLPHLSSLACTETGLHCVLYNRAHLSLQGGSKCYVEYFLDLLAILRDTSYSDLFWDEGGHTHQCKLQVPLEGSTVQCFSLKVNSACPMMPRLALTSPKAHFCLVGLCCLVHQACCCYCVPMAWVQLGSINLSIN